MCLNVRLAEVGRRHALSMLTFGVLLYSMGTVLLASTSAPGPVVGFWRLWLGAPLFVVATALGLRFGAQRPTRRGVLWACGSGMVFGLQQLCLISGLQNAGVTTVALLTVVSPVIVGFLAYPMFGETVTLRFALWAGLAMLGAAVVVSSGPSAAGGSWVGVLLACANAVLFSMFYVMSKAAREHIDVLPFYGITFTVGALAVSVWCFATGLPVGSVDRWDILVALLVALGPGGIGHFATTWPLRWVQAIVPPILRLAQPVLASFLAWIFLHEVVGPAHLLGGALTAAGLVGALRSGGR